MLKSILKHARVTPEDAVVCPLEMFEEARTWTFELEHPPTVSPPPVCANSTVCLEQEGERAPCPEMSPDSQAQGGGDLSLRGQTGESTGCIG